MKKFSILVMLVVLLALGFVSCDNGGGAFAGLGGLGDGGGVGNGETFPSFLRGTWSKSDESIYGVQTTTITITSNTLTETALWDGTLSYKAIYSLISFYEQDFDDPDWPTGYSISLVCTGGSGTNFNQSMVGESEGRYIRLNNAKNQWYGGYTKQ